MNIESYSIKGLRTAYEAYLQEIHEGASSRFIRTKSDDAFCLFRWFPANEAMSYTQGVHDPDIKAAVINILVSGKLKDRKKPEKDAKGYLREVEKLRRFLQIISLVEASKIKTPRKIKNP